MVTTELGACEWFVWDLRRSNLIDRGQLDQIIGDYLSKHPRAEPPALGRVSRRPKNLDEFPGRALACRARRRGLSWGRSRSWIRSAAGSMGTVYKAQSKTDSQWYAVKVLPRRSMWNVRIARRKVRAFEQARHPSVVPFVDVGTAGGMHYLAWPFVEGETLDKVMAREGKIQPGPGGQICPASRRRAGCLPSARLDPWPDEALQLDGLRRRANEDIWISASAACWPRPKANRWSIPCRRRTPWPAAWIAPAPKASWTRPTSRRRATNIV